MTSSGTPPPSSPSHTDHAPPNAIRPSPRRRLSDDLRRRYDFIDFQGQPRQPFARLTSESALRAALFEHRMSVNPAHEVAWNLATHSMQRSEVGESESGEDLEGESMAEEMDQMLLDEQEQQQHVEKMDTSLPADDGMHSLRLKLQEIRNLAISTEEKARRMHTLMIEQYMAHHAGDTSPLSLHSDSRSLIEEPAALEIGAAALPIDPSNPYNLRPGDLEPSISPLALPVPPEHDLDESMEMEEQPALGCMHYLRNVKVQCFDCHRWFPCRHCHDQSHDLPYPHNLRRKMIRNMLCMLCQTPQPAAETCLNCGEWAAYYYCDKCKLWDNDSNKSIYHCDDCGICRLGRGLGKDFVHCKKCNVCISISTSAEHPCVEGATEGNCPLCLEEMFASRVKVVSLPCGHYMHGFCYRDLMAVTYKCPVCSKSAVNMELQWRKLDDDIRAQPMPDDDEELGPILPHIEGHIEEDAVGSTSPNPPPVQRRPKTVWIGCNDCGGRCWTRFHWLGLKCRHCDSYNTNQMAPTAGHETETERLIRQQQQTHRQHDFTGNAVLRDAGIDTERVDSALGVPSSPSSHLAVPAPASPGSPSSLASSPRGGASSPRRYFVQEEERRRPSFTVPRFSTPNLPTLPNFPEMPRLPRMPILPPMPNLPHMPNLPNMPNLPPMPNMPHLPELGLPELGLPRFPTYAGVFDSLSRSLSPMRYYLQGQDVHDEQHRAVFGRRDGNRSPTSVHSDPFAGKRRTSSSSRLRDGKWSSDGSDEVGSLADDVDQEERERRRGVFGFGGGGDEEDSETDDSDDEEEEEEDEEEREDGDVQMRGEGQVMGRDLDMDLPGHI